MDNNLSFKTFFDNIAQKHPTATQDQLFKAINTSFNTFTANPIVQNTRVKRISSLPIDFDKNDIVRFLKNPNYSEQPLRQVGHSLEVAAYPYFKLRKTYQDILTYKYYNAPSFIEDDIKESKELMREWRLVDKMCRKMNIKSLTHEITGQALQEGKVFYTFRYSLDKAHNKVNFAFGQQLPSDWCKIVGFNNVSKYTVAFNMMYFMQPGTTWQQFGNLFEPYLSDFNTVMGANPSEKPTDKRVVYAEDYSRIDRLNELKNNADGGQLNGNPDFYKQDGTWFYWVTLPPHMAWTFEIDDVSRNVFSPFSGLMLSMAQISRYEEIQLEMIQNPLISVLTGEIPYRDEKTASADDDYKLSIAGKMLFETYWYNMLEQANTGGIGLYLAPVENLKLQTLSEAPSATEISANGYKYVMNKAAIGAIIPLVDDPKAGLASLSSKLEAKFTNCIYEQMMRLMNWLYENANLKYEWTFRMFGDIYSDADKIKATKDGMTLGILTDTLVYLALNDLTLVDDISISRAVKASGVLDLRLPLVSTYSAKAGEGTLPPKTGTPPIDPKIDPNKKPQGRPQTEGITSEGKEHAIDLED